MVEALLRWLEAECGFLAENDKAELPELSEFEDSIDSKEFVVSLLSLCDFFPSLVFTLLLAVASSYDGGCSTNGGGGASVSEVEEFERNRIGDIPASTGFVRDIGDKVLPLIVEALEFDLDLPVGMGEIIGDSSSDLKRGVSRNSGLIAFSSGDAIGEKGFACGDSISIGTEVSGLNKFESKIVSPLGDISLSKDSLCLEFGFLLERFFLLELLEL